MDSSDISFLAELFQNANSGVQVALLVVACAIVVLCVIAFIVSIYLSIAYVKYNRVENSAGINGEEAARKVLDANGLENIKVKVVGSLLFGNSYSHYFKKVRLRRWTIKKTSVASLAMGTQKAALAVLDKEDDPDMRNRVRMVPIISFGPLAFIPLVIVGVLIDVLVCNSEGTVTIVLCCLGAAFYVLSFIMSLLTLKTEKKAQERAYVLLRENGMATEEEIGMMKRLFHLYNIEYVNDMILSTLELIYYVLKLVAMAQGKGGAASTN